MVPLFNYRVCCHSCWNEIIKLLFRRVIVKFVLIFSQFETKFVDYYFKENERWVVRHSTDVMILINNEPALVLLLGRWFDWGPYS